MLTFKNIGRMGRMANAMFSIAGTIGIARKSGQEFCFPKFINYDAKERFNSTEDINVFQQMLNPLPDFRDVIYEEYPYYWGYRDLRLVSGNWNLNSHFQSEKYFIDCIDEVRYYFTFKDEFPPMDYVAIHYRAGDYDSDPNGYHPRVSKEYLEAAMKEFPNSEFLVFSDDMTEAVKLLNGPNVLFHGGKDYIEDFKMMKACKHFIIANSSFSLMASILANQPGKKIVAPKKWFGPHVGLETADLYPENCIVL